MLYCIGCVHLKYADKLKPGGDSQTGSWTVEEAAMLCSLGRWKTHLRADVQLFDFAKAMESAETCPQYEERPGPDEDNKHA